MNTTDHKSTWSVLNKKRHIERLIEGLKGELSSQFEKIVPSQTWIVYWICHSLSLLEQKQFISTIKEDVIKFINECADPNGGYGGGPGQIAHLATSFAAVNSLITLNYEPALDTIDRIGLVRFMNRVKHDDGSFSMHEDGEIDSRATYCALSILRSLNIRDTRLLNNVADWILSCQTYEGGFGSVPGSEAHGGYTFCCVASLCLLNQLDRANLPALMRWLTNKQLEEEGGFCGRSNKLVDSCYSYWQGAVFPMLHPYLDLPLESELDCKRDFQGNEEIDQNFIELAKTLNNSWMFDCASLQDYLLNKCQNKNGLLRDKPGATPDFYHTCYALSGLSLSQHQPDGCISDVGSKQINILAMTHPLFNIEVNSLNDCFEYFKKSRVEIDYDSMHEKSNHQNETKDKII